MSEGTKVQEKTKLFQDFPRQFWAPKSCGDLEAKRGEGAKNPPIGF